MMATRAFRQLSASRLPLLVGSSRQHAIRSFSISYPRSIEKPQDPYPLPLSREVEKQRAAPSGGIESSESSALNTTTEEEWPMPQPLDRTGEDEQTIRARLVYQTRKRGMLEGDLLLSTFARDNLGDMTMAQLQEFDKVSRFHWSLGTATYRRVSDQPLDA